MANKIMRIRGNRQGRGEGRQEKHSFSKMQTAKRRRRAAGNYFYKIAEKIANAKKSNWVSEGISKSEVKTIVELAKISAQIERCRLDMGMTQQKFAEYMGVTQAMVSKWESREYNFTIRTLNEICQKTNLKLFVSLDKPCVKSDYNIVEWESEKVGKKRRDNGYLRLVYDKGAIA